MKHITATAVGNGERKMLASLQVDESCHEAAVSFAKSLSAKGCKIELGGDTQVETKKTFGKKPEPEDES